MANAPTLKEVEALNECSGRLRKRSTAACRDARDLLNGIARSERERAAARGAQGDSAERRSSNLFYRVHRSLTSDQLPTLVCLTD